MEDIESKTVNELKQYCREKDIRGFSQKRKQELIDFINDYHEQENVNGKVEEEEDLEEEDEGVEKDGWVEEEEEDEIEEVENEEDEIEEVENEEDEKVDEIKKTIKNEISLNIGDSFDFIKTLDNESVNMIYLDPPFNSNRNYKLNNNSDIGFEDKWDNDTYTEFLTKLINLLYPILTKNGSLFFHISSDCMFIPEVILRKKFKCVTPIFWKKCRSKNNVKQKLGTLIDIIFKCNKISKSKFNLILQEKDEKYLKNSFKNKDNIGNYSLGHLVTENTKKGYMYNFIINNKEFNPVSGWRIKKSKLIELRDENRLYIPKKKGANLYKKIYLKEHPGKPCTDLWDDISSISQGKEKRKYPTAKPVKLLERIIEISTDLNDIVLDPMCGSGTTGEACFNLNRKCILNDINNDIIDIIKTRIQDLKLI